MNNLIRRLVAGLIADDPAPEPSQLDRWDGQREALCSVIGCPNDPTTAPHGWAVCEQHSPSGCEQRSASDRPEHCPVNV